MKKQVGKDDRGYVHSPRRRNDVEELAMLEMDGSSAEAVHGYYQQYQPEYEVEKEPAKKLILRVMH
jgi:hypothetical protein